MTDSLQAQTPAYVAPGPTSTTEVRVSPTALNAAEVVMYPNLLNSNTLYRSQTATELKQSTMSYFQNAVMSIESNPGRAKKDCEMDTEGLRPLYKNMEI